MALEADYYELDSTDVANKYVDLSGTPTVTDNVAMDLIGGTAQAINGDFAVDGTRVKWDSTSYNLYSQLGVGDKIRVLYDRS
jgi:hypothetical protein